MTAAHSLVGFGPESATDFEIGDLPFPPLRVNYSSLVLIDARDPLPRGRLPTQLPFPDSRFGILSRTDWGRLWSHTQRRSTILLRDYHCRNSRFGILSRNGSGSPCFLLASLAVTDSGTRQAALVGVALGCYSFDNPLGGT